MMLQNNQNSSQKVQINLGQKAASPFSEQIDRDVKSINSAKFSEKVLRGANFEAENELDQAIVCYLQAIELNPRSVKAHQLLAAAFQKKGNPTEAKLHNDIAKRLKFSSSIDSDNLASTNTDSKSFQRNASSHKNNNRSLDENQANSDSGENNTTTVDKAGIILPNASEIYFKNYLEQPELRVGNAYLEQASSYYKEGNLVKTVEACKKALSISPDLAQAYKLWGNCLQKQRNTSEALGLYAKALEIDPEFAEVYANMGSLLATKKRWSEAINYFQQALNIDPRIPSVYRNLAKIWETIGNAGKAEECLFKAIALEPETLTPQQYFQLANELNLEQKQQKAIACYRYAIQLQPDYQKAYLKLIDLLEANEQWQEANKYYRQLLTLNNSNSSKQDVSQSSTRIRNLLAIASKKTLPETGSQKKALLPASEKLSFLQLSPASAGRDSSRSVAVADLNPDSASAKLELGRLSGKKKSGDKQLISFVKQSD